MIERIVENIRTMNRESGVTFVVVEHNIDVLKAALAPPGGA